MVKTNYLTHRLAHHKPDTQVDLAAFVTRQKIIRDKWNDALKRELREDEGQSTVVSLCKVLGIVLIAVFIVVINLAFGTVCHNMAPAHFTTLTP